MDYSIEDIHEVLKVEGILVNHLTQLKSLKRNRKLLPNIFSAIDSKSEHENATNK